MLTSFFRRFAIMAMVLLMVAVGAFAQTALPQDYATAGLFYNSYATPHVTGYGAYATKIGTSTYSYSVVDVTSISVKPFRPQTSMTSGVATLLKTFGGVNIFGLATAGPSIAPAATGSGGTDVGFGGSAGFLAVKPLKNGWTLDIPVRMIVSTIETKPQYVVGIGIGWGGSK